MKTPANSLSPLGGTAPAGAGSVPHADRTLPNDTVDRFKVEDAGSYDDVVGNYERFVDRFSPPIADWIVSLGGVGGNLQVLDVGTGTGVVALEAARRLRGGQVTGIDLSEGMLAGAEEKANRLQTRPPVTFRRMDAEALELEDEAFDVALSLYALLHFPNPLTALREIRRVLRPGGLAVIAVGSRPPLASLHTLSAGAAHLVALVNEARGLRLTAPKYLDALVTARFPDVDRAELTNLAEGGMRRTASVVAYARQAGFRILKTYWRRYEASITDAQEFWELQRTFSSTARKRLQDRPAAAVDALRAEFLKRAGDVLDRGGTLAYPYAAFVVVAQRPTR
jgi:ubiquinone/menaquinone biosynthesis C-methylase UbiE